ncbi:TonB-dependent receptor [Paucihalobacter sp.]|uniref:TonB-dependent receptor n=1 Tax=Paucihalobacter sp. TaxID=2850405 RepID=UPI003D1606A4
MQKHILYSTFFIAIFSAVSMAQERKTDTIDTQSVNVVKPYTPTISDAFKIKEIPVLDEDNNLKKQVVKYNIFSIPVASTFTPAKGKAAAVDKQKQQKLYENYASLGVGSYTSILGELYVNHELIRGENVGGSFTHHSSQGGIDDVLLDDSFSKTGLTAYFSKALRDFDWKIDAGYQRNMFNWYGLPQPFFDESTAGGIDPSHTFNDVNIQGSLNFNDAIINNGSVLFRRFADDRGSAENRFVAETGFDIPVRGEQIAASFKVDYLKGEFDNDYFGSQSLSYGNINLGVKAAYQLEQDDLSVSLGANLVYLNDTETSKNKFFIYPNLSASYNLVSDVVVAYASITGNLIQNTYSNFANSNPFVSPTLNIAPTDQTYNASIGMKGKLSNAISYNINGSYLDEKVKPLFKANSVVTGATQDYQNGNSFGIIYDDVRTFSVLGQLSADINRNINVVLQGEYFGYSLTTQSEAWNLPDFKASAVVNAQIDEHWFVGASLFFVGERKDEFRVDGTLFPTAPVTITLDSFFDANLHAGYRINQQLSVFGKVNNLLNNDYQNWSNFQVQGIQVLAGATYQFDF